MDVPEQYSHHPYFPVADRLAHLRFEGTAPTDLYLKISDVPNRDQGGRGTREFFLEVMRDLERLELEQYPFISPEEFVRFLIDEADSAHKGSAAQRAGAWIGELDALAMGGLGSADLDVQASALKRQEARNSALRRARDQAFAMREERERWVATRKRQAAEDERRMVEEQARAAMRKAKIEAREARVLAGYMSLVERMNQLGTRDEKEALAISEFEALGKRMSAATSREELVDLGRLRAKVAPLISQPFVYESHCWNCKGYISSEIHARCPACHWYICSCGACRYGCSGNVGSEYDGGDDLPF